MQDNAIYFLLFAVIIILFFYIIPIRYRAGYLLLGSVLFYLLCDAFFMMLLLLEAGVSYVLSYHIKRRREKGKRYLAAGIIFTVIILSVFKYKGFFIDSISAFLSFNKDSIFLSVGMPLGISYYSFKIISYLVDVYTDKIEPALKWEEYFLYILFFPQIICGPISRYDELTEQFKYKCKFQPELFTEGIFLVVSGLYKKLVIADRLAGYVNVVYAEPRAYTGLALGMASFFYSIQLYCDFSGYSEIMIGISNMLGIRCKANFAYPYFSKNIKEFWQRWHISLSTWLRDYIYIPLGGNKCSKNRKHLNLLITFLVSGMWHGNRITFVIWGLYHGILNCMSGKRTGHDGNLKKAVKVIITFTLVGIGWTMFRVDTVQDFILFYAGMISRFSLNIDAIQQAILPFTYDYSCFSYFLCMVLMLTILFVKEYKEIKKQMDSDSKVKWNIVYLVFLFFFAKFGESNFMYANF